MNEKIAEWIKKTIAEVCSTFDNYDEGRLGISLNNLSDELCSFSNAETNIITEYFEKNITSEDLIYVLSVMGKYMKIDRFYEIFIKAIMNSRYSVITKVFMYYQLRRRTDFVCRNSLLLNFHASNTARFINEYQLNYEYIPIEQRNKTKIVIMTDQMLSEKHAPSLVVKRCAYSLKKYLGYDVSIVAIPIRVTSEMNKEVWNGKIDFENNNPIAEKSFLKECYKDIEFDLYQVSTDNPYFAKEIKMLFDIVYAWKPLCVYALGSTASFADVIRSFTTEVFEDMTIGIPISQADVIVASEIDVQEDYKADDYYPISNQFVYKNESIKPFFEKSNAPLNKIDIGCKDNDFVMCIVGNRLSNEVDDEMLAMIKKICNEFTQAKFIFVGDTTGLHDKIGKLDISERIIEYGYCEDLMGLYYAVDLYVNPNRKGGGYSGYMALTAGVPLITLPGGDVSANVGDEFTVASMEDMFLTICQYMSDNNKYLDIKKYTLDKAREGSEESYWDKVGRRLKEIINTGIKGTTID